MKPRRLIREKQKHALDHDSVCSGLVLIHPIVKRRVRPGGSPDGYLAVKYAGFTPLLVEGLKELDDIVSEQQRKTDDMGAALDTRLTVSEAILR